MSRCSSTAHRRSRGSAVPKKRAAASLISAGPPRKRRRKSPLDLYIHENWRDCGLNHLGTFARRKRL
eukprot:9455565-Pyramimonas_sp.AAC.1